MLSGKCRLKHWVWPVGLTLRQKVAAATLAGLAWAGGVSAQTNSWLGGSGGWQTTNLWSLNQTPSSNQNIVVTNTGTFTVTIDDTTASNFPGTLAISNLTASGTAGTSTLLLTNRPTSTVPILLTIANNAVIGPGSVLNAVDTSAGQLGISVQASSFTIDGSVLCEGNADL